MGYLRQCSIFADLNADGVADANEPAGTTDEFGGWSLTVEPSDAGSAQLILEPSDKCIDRYTNLPLTVTLTAPDGCQMVSMLTDVKKRQIDILTSEDNNKDDAVAKSDEAVALALGLVDPDGFDVCTYDPIEAIWAKDLTSSRRRLETPAELLAKVLALNTELIAVTEQISTVAGFEGEAQYQMAANAVQQGVAEQMLSAESAEQDLETLELVKAAVNATGVEVSDVFEDDLAAATGATAEYVTVASKAIATKANGTNAVIVLEEYAKVGALAQTDDAEVATVLENARSTGTKDLTAFETSLQEKLVEASSIVELDKTLEAIQVPKPQQAPLPSPSTPIVAFQPPPLPPTVPTAEKSSTDDEKLLLLVLLVLLFPIAFAMYVCFSFPDKIGLYMRYRFSHSNPHVLCFYVPREARGRMRSVLFGHEEGNSVNGVVSAKNHPDLKQKSDLKEDLALAKGTPPSGAGAPGPSLEAGAPGPSTEQYVPYRAGRV